MNTTPSPRPTAFRPAALVARCSAFGLAAVAGLTLAGCSFLKPARSEVRHFLLTPVPPVVANAIPAGAPSVGLGQVKLPAYLFNTSLAVRRGTNQVDYLPLTLWAERLDTSVQRVLAANLAALLPTDKVRLSEWRSEDVSVEVYVALERFDVDASGQATLIAWWRLVAPGGGKTLKSGQTNLVRPGPSPDTNAAGAVSNLSEILADFSRQLAGAIKEAGTGNP
jgi:uncharacterized lipoprotein YmbA